MIIGLTGKNASGKGEIARYLQGVGWAACSLSDVVREEVKARGETLERDNLIRVGQALRREGGPGVLAKRLVARLTGRDVVDSIRHPEEIRTLRAHDRLVVIGVDAPPRVRFERLRARNRIGDAASFEQFCLQEAAEDTADPNAQQLSACLAMADVVISNDGDLQALTQSVDREVAKIFPPL